MEQIFRGDYDFLYVPGFDVHRAQLISKSIDPEHTPLCVPNLIVNQDQSMGVAGSNREFSDLAGLGIESAYFIGTKLQEPDRPVSTLYNLVRFAVGRGSVIFLLCEIPRWLVGLIVTGATAVGLILIQVVFGESPFSFLTMAKVWNGIS